MHLLRCYIPQDADSQSRTGERMTGNQMFLSLYNIGIEEVRGERNGTPYRGLLYTLLDENGDKAVAAPLKSLSLIHI